MSQRITKISKIHPFALRKRAPTEFFYQETLEETDPETLRQWLGNDLISDDQIRRLEEGLYDTGVKRQIVAFVTIPGEPPRKNTPFSDIWLDYFEDQSPCKDAPPQALVLAEVRGGNRRLVACVAEMVLEQFRQNAGQIIRPPHVPMRHPRDHHMAYPFMIPEKMTRFWMGNVNLGLAASASDSHDAPDRRVALWAVLPEYQDASKVNQEGLHSVLRDCKDIIDRGCVIPIAPRPQHKTRLCLCAPTR
ncbi:MAG: hypothetical protein IPI58_06575 [Alphaproteobacteria bacterium]|nr:MAG: hypothetical protein IPI58_06575 [Alphaproteobacteria bacterium]